MDIIRSHNRLLFIVTVAIIICFSCQNCKNAYRDQRKDRPNVILILADDMAYGDLSFVNDTLSRTPNLDRLAEEGIWFDQGYSAAPVCAPARASLLTGKYPHQTGCITLNMRSYPELTRLDSSLVTMADVFSENGYVTGLIGKWHCGEGEGYHPMDRGFNEFEGFLGYKVNSYFSYELDINREYQKYDGSYLTEVLSQKAIDFVRRHQKEPFFLHLAHYAPHRPLHAPQEAVDHYLQKGFDENTSKVYAMIEIMDRGIGELIEELDRLGIRENTLVIFASDNGPAPQNGERPNQGLRGTKYTIYEGGIRVPFLFNWEGKLAAARKDQVVHFIDIFPTLAELCDLKITGPIHFEGGSLAPLMFGEDPAGLPQQRYWQWNRGVPYYTHNAAMRYGSWKLVRPFVTRNEPGGPSDQQPVLYDLKNDPFEVKDVSKENQGIYVYMNMMIEQWSREVEFARLQNYNK